MNSGGPCAGVAGQPSAGKPSAWRRGVLGTPALRKPGAALSAATAAEVDLLMVRLQRRLEELG